MKKLVVASFCFAFSTLSLANMTLQPDNSLLSFVSTKQDAVAEIHKITKLSGSIRGDVATVIIDLNSVDSKIGIRDQRMRDHLFETGTFAAATYTVPVNSIQLKELTEGKQVIQSITGELNLHGHTAAIDASIQITRQKYGTLTATTVEPIIINASDFDMVKGINTLRDLAGLKNISYAVPVTFSVEFK